MVEIKIASRQANNQAELSTARARLAYNTRRYHVWRTYHSWQSHNNVQLSLEA